MNGSIKIQIIWIDKTTGEPLENQDLTKREKLDNYAATLDYMLKKTKRPTSNSLTDRPHLPTRGNQ